MDVFRPTRGASLAKPLRHRLRGHHLLATGHCCFDYGNSENNQLVPWRGGAGSMEAIYFGNAPWHGNRGLGHGPWVGADLEAGMYYGQSVSACVSLCQPRVTH